MKRQFYPTLVLLIALHQSFRLKPHRHVDTPFNSPYVPSELLRKFLSRLAFLCCTDSGSNTISACAVVKLHDDTLEYVFAFNQVSSPKLRTMKEGIQQTLRMFRQTPMSNDGLNEILSHVLTFNLVRVKAYLKAYRRHLNDCILQCKRETGEESASLMAILQRLESETNSALGISPISREVDTAATRQLIGSVHDIYHGEEVKWIQLRVAKEYQNSAVVDEMPWADLVHVSGRLITYKRAVEVCRMAFQEWPQLLENYEVRMLPSSSPMSKALKKQVLTADGCMGKTIGAESSLRQEFDCQYERLQEYGKLDDAVADIWRSDPSPIVHSEMQLLHYLENTQEQGGTKRSRFFLGEQFIGTSKPPCRLCSYYFQDSGTPVEVRPSHRNVYLHWRIADAYDQLAVTRRDNLYRKLKQRLEEDLYQVLKDKSTEGSHHDSTNYFGAKSFVNRHWTNAAGSIRSNTATPAMSEVSRPVSSFEMHGEGSFPSARSWGENEDVARKGPNAPVSSMEAHLEAQMGVTGRAAASRGETRLSALSSGASAYTMVTMEDPLRIGPAEEDEDEDEDGGGVLLFSGRNRGTALKRRGLNTSTPS